MACCVPMKTLLTLVTLVQSMVLVVPMVSHRERPSAASDGSVAAGSTTSLQVREVESPLVVVATILTRCSPASTGTSMDVPS